jgi:Fe-S-cluster containining protein
LFTHVALTQEEDRRLGLIGVIRQPCPQLGEGCRCRIYLERPKGCKQFICMLGRALEDGEVGLQEAVSRVQEAKALRGRIDALVPGPGAAINKARQYEDRGPDPEVAVQVRDARRALEAFTARYFLGRR